MEAEDVLTAIQARAAFSFVQPPSQDVRATVALAVSTSRPSTVPLTCCSAAVHLAVDAGSLHRVSCTLPR